MDFSKPIDLQCYKRNSVCFHLLLDSMEFGLGELMVERARIVVQGRMLAVHSVRKNNLATLVQSLSSPRTLTSL